jgi:molecular chaperone HscB
MAECWSCGAERGDASFCSTCGKVQPVSKKVDYFEMLGLMRTMRMDKDELERCYREESRRVHPDRFGMATPVERKLALEQSIAVNDAYRTLKDPQKRAEYLITLEGVEFGKEESRTKDPALLMEMMELQERVDREGSPEALEKIRDKAKTEEGALFDSLARYFDDHAGTRAATLETLERLRYIRRLFDRIDRKLEERS